MESVFDRSGLASLSDLSDPEYQKLFVELESEQRSFLERDSQFRSSSYTWPRDALHHWGRIWEYPYVYCHLKHRLSVIQPTAEAKVADLGCAVTFFPFSVAQLGYHVSCLDIEASYGPDIVRAAQAIEHGPGEVNFGLISNGCLPLGDRELDALYCISVLEHIDDFERIKQTIQEIWRVLKPGGLFILTIDVDFCGHMSICIRDFYNLRKCLFQRFGLSKPEVTIHPLDILQYRNGPYPYMTYSIWQKWKFQIRQKVKPFFGKKPLRALPNLAIWCAVMTKTE